MKIIKILIATAVLSFVILPMQVSAAWWNPFTWSIFQKQTISNSTSTVIRVTNKTSSDTPTITPAISVKPPSQEPARITKTQSSSKPVPATAQDLKKSDSQTQTASFSKATDVTEIRAKLVGLVGLLKSKNSTDIERLVSPQAKEYFNTILTLSKTAPKEDVVSKGFSTALSVVIIRLVATSTTTTIQENDLIAKLLTLSSSVDINKIDPNKVSTTITPIDPSTASAVVTYDGKNVLSVRFVNENGSWYVDPSHTFKSLDAEIEKNIQAQSKKNGRTHSEIMESTLRLLLDDSGGFEYYAWVPLNKRSDLNPTLAKMNGLAILGEGYSIQYPEHWTFERVEQSEFIWAPYSNDGVKPAIVITANLTPYTTDLDVYTRDIIESLPKVKADVSGEIKSAKVTFLGQPAYKLSYKRLRTNNGGRTYSTQQNESHVFFRNGFVYLVEYRNGVLDFEATRPLVEKTINTLKFGQPCSQNCRTDMYDNN